MALAWIHENPPYWDRSKAAIVGGAPKGALDVRERNDGEIVPGEWWRVEQDGRTVGYGWMDTNWGDAEILLAVDPRTLGAGVGTFILDRLEDEARARGLNYLYNVVRDTHPERSRVTRWLEDRGFVESEGGLLKRAVKRAV